jgi:hypothetical protein
LRFGVEKRLHVVAPRERAEALARGGRPHKFVRVDRL